MFSLTIQKIEMSSLIDSVYEQDCGAVISFEGRVRNHNEGKAVLGLEYEVYADLAISEGQKILHEALDRHRIKNAIATHRIGKLGLGELAVGVVISAAHRDEAFLACRFVIDSIKYRLPIWKKEYYASGDSEWVHCAACYHRGVHTDHHHAPT